MSRRSRLISLLCTRSATINRRGNKFFRTLIDEEAGSPNHPELWKQFASALGVDDGRSCEDRKANGNENLIDAFRSACGEGSTAEGLATLYAYESQDSGDLRIEDRRIEAALRFQRFERLRIFLGPHRSGQRTFRGRARNAHGQDRQSQHRQRPRVSESRSRCALGNAERRLPASRDRLLAWRNSFGDVDVETLFHFRLTKR